MTSGCALTSRCLKIAQLGLHSINRFWPSAAPRAQPIVKFSTLTDALADSTGGQVQLRRNGRNFICKSFRWCFHTQTIV